MPCKYIQSLIANNKKLELTQACRELRRLTKPTLVSSVRSGARGRPRKIIDLSWLQNATQSRRRLSLNAIARTLGVHRNTLRPHLNRSRLHRQFSPITDEELENLAREFRQQKPTSGYRYFMGHLQAQGLIVQRDRLIMALKNVSRTAHELRTH